MRLADDWQSTGKVGILTWLRKRKSEKRERTKVEARAR
jgi:hypothetical protein